MSMQSVLDAMRRLKLYGAIEAMLEHDAQSDIGSLTFLQRLELMLAREEATRDSRRISRNLKAAKMPEEAYIEGILFTPRRGLDRGQVMELGSCEWITDRRNILIDGRTGTGKSWMACALGHQACRRGKTVLYKRAKRLSEELLIAHMDGSIAKYRQSLAKVDALIIDDFGMTPLTLEIKNDLLEIAEDRSHSGATIITSQLPVNKWHAYIDEPTIADAFMDRIVHRAHRFSLHGESMRKTRGTKTEE